MTDKTDMTVEEGRRLVALLRKYFFNRLDKVAALMSWAKPHPVMGDDNLPGLLLAHVMGEASPHKGAARFENRNGAIRVINGAFRLGSYTPDDKGNTLWLCLDFDGAGHSDPLEDPEGAVRLTHAAFSAVGLPSYIEQSGSGKGWHLWVFFTEPTPAKLVRTLAHSLIPANLPLAKGKGVALPRSNRGVEVFPKTVQATTSKRPGNLVWLPWYHAAKPGANQFYQDVNGALTPFVPEAFETATQEAVERVLADPAATPLPGKTASSGPRTRVDDEALDAFLRIAKKADDAIKPPSTDWRTWKEQALARLDLDQVYGRWLTGEVSGDGWLQCQDPDSESGSASRSGNVADGSREAHRGSFHSWRSNESMSVFDFMVQHNLASSFIDAAKQIAEWTGVPLPDSKQAKPETVGGNLLPVIVTNNRQTRDIIEEAQYVIQGNNGKNPFLFRQGRRVLRILTSASGAWAEDVSEQVAYGYLIRLANWVRRTEEGDDDVAPSHEISRDLVTNPPEGLHPLEMIVSSPVFTPAKKLLQEPGYDRESGIWYWQSRGMHGLSVPSAPTSADVQAALSLLLEDVLVDFPFPTPGDRAHALEAMLIPFMKPMIRGLCPIHLIEAPAIGSGKSLLAKLVHLIAAGTSAPITTMGRDEEETRKKITSLLAGGARIVIVDNVVDGVSSSNLAAAVTSEVWKDRWLGTQEMPELPNNAIWFFTGNNPDLSLEIARRCIRIRIEAPEEKPWLRRDFKHDPIEDWVTAHRPELVRAILVLIQAWVNDGARLADVTMGSFQPWAKTMGGILDFLGVRGFLENRTEMFETVDPQENEWRAFIVVWWDRFGGLPVLATDLRALAEQHDMLAACRGTKSESSQTVRLGKELRRLRGRRFGHLRIALGRPGRDKANRWGLVAVSDDGVDPGDDFPFADGPDDRGATVTDLFASVDGKDRGGTSGSAARRVEPEARRVNEQPSAAESGLAGGPRRVAEGADSDPGVTQRARTHDGRARTHVSSACAHNVREVPINPPHPPRPSADQLESASAARRVGGNTLRGSPINPPRVDDEADSLDLLHIPETSSEDES